MDEKKCMVVNVFKERKLDIMALSETKVKGSGLREWEGQRVIVSGVSERCRAREGVAVMIAGRMWGKVVEYKCLDSRIMWVKLKLDGEIVVVVSVYVPGMEKKEDERERFWARFSECLAGFESSERVIVLGDMNAKVGDRERDGIVGKFGVPGMNENGVCLLELCNERGLIVGNTWFEKKLIHNYTWEREDDVERNMIDLIFVEELMRKRLMEVTVRRGVAGRISDHFVAECKVKWMCLKEVCK